MSNGKEQLAASKKMLLALKKMKDKVKELETAQREPIAVIGMSCRFPGGNNCTEYWKTLQQGIDAISVVPKDRWDIDQYYDPDPEKPGKMYTKYGGFIKNVGDFDAQFFGISPREAISMDPQHRIFLEVSWEALEHARQISPKLRKSKTGVFVGASTNDYSRHFFEGYDSDLINAYFGTGNSHSAIAGRLSYLLGLQGPSISVDTACSSSLVGIHLACQSLRNNECNLALAGGVNLTLVPFTTINFCKARMMAPDGRCKTFDAAADGYVRGEGCGMIVLKRLSEALRDRDNILATIRGSAVNQDGPSGGLTAPNGPSQEAVILEALDNANLKPQDVQYVEAHGTGTSLGDPIEVQALSNALRRNGGTPLTIGSVKTNIGHLEAASGIAGVIKVILCLQKEEIPAHLNFKNPSTYIPWEKIAVEVAQKTKSWKRTENSRIAGVSSFGFIGTNAHVLLEEAPIVTEEKNEIERPAHILSLSAKSKESLGKLAKKMQQKMSENLANYCYTANTGKGLFSHRLALVESSSEDMLHSLQKFIEKENKNTKILSQENKVAFLFTGQGSQYINMGKELYETCPTFRKNMKMCDKILHDEINRSIIDLIYGKNEEENCLIHETEFTQPALFCIEYSLAKLWISWGVEPNIVMGHSVGEYAAACIAGVFDVTSGLKLIAKRAKLMQSLPNDGGMLSISSSLENVADIVASFSLDIAAINGPKSTVVSGKKEKLLLLEKELDKKEIHTQMLEVSHAFHSELMEPILNEFYSFAENITYSLPEIAIVSNLTGEIAESEIISNANYWKKHIRETVCFTKSIDTLLEQRINTFIEVGPAPVLLGMARACSSDKNNAWLPSLRKGRGDWKQILDSVSKSYTRGIDIDWIGFDADYKRWTIELPTYPFDRKRYWVRTGATNTKSQTYIHPFIENKFTSPAMKQVIFQSEMSTSLWPEAEEHKVYGWKILPGAFYAEMALAAQKHYNIDTCISELQILEPCTIDAEIQLILSQQNSNWEIYSKNDQDWKLHAIGKFGKALTIAEINIEDIKERCIKKANIEELYDFFENLGFEYGPHFRLIKDAWYNKEGEVIARISLGGEDAKKFELHPCALDACFQAFSLALIDKKQSTKKVYIPVGIDNYSLFLSGMSNFWVHIKVNEPKNEDTLIGDMQLFTDSGDLIALIEGFTVKSISRNVLERSFGEAVVDNLFQINWQSISIEASTLIEKKLIIFANDKEEAKIIAGDIPYWGILFSDEKKQEGNILYCNPKDDISWIWETIRNSENYTILYMWDFTNEDVVTNANVSAITLLKVAQTLVISGLDRKCQFNLISILCQSVTKNDAISLNPTWGLGRVLSQECPQLECKMIDLEVFNREQIFQGLSCKNEKQIAFRNDKAYVARLDLAMQSATKLLVPSSDYYQLSMEQKGSLENLRYMPTKKKELEAKEMEIAVEATGLNFRDVMSALGLYPGEAGELGGECCGRVTRKGSEVQDIEIGDTVFGIVAGSFANKAYSFRHLVTKKPENITDVEAATMPITFLTAYYGLYKLASLSKGQKVLIHSASGGVGLAAVQLAQYQGAEIFATAGNEEKRSFLKSLGVQHVMDSRSLSFYEEIQKIAPEGIDVVLNALAGEYVTKSIALLKDGGYFLEIGKTDIWSSEQIAKVPNIHYYAFDLAEICEKEPILLQEMFATLIGFLEKKAITSLPHKVFSREETIDAFRYMAQAKHIGKVVVANANAKANVFDKEASYLITGGLGALGLNFAQMLANEGAKHIALVSRREDITAVVDQIEKIEKQGTEISILKVDVSDYDALEKCWEKLTDKPPLKGIIHAAGAIDDRLLLQQDEKSFAHTMQSKVSGSWNLHSLTKNDALDFFVMFSSLASILGSVGQANYATANAFMDNLAHYRHSKGMPAMSINWGPWSEIGMAADLSKRGQDVWSTMGINSISPQQGSQLYQLISKMDNAQVIAMPLDWGIFAQKFAQESLFEKIVAIGKEKSQYREQESLWLKELESKPIKQRRNILLGYIVEKTKNILGLTEIDITEPLQELGLDSLMAVELKNILEMSIGKTLPATMLFNYPTIDTITSYLVEDVLEIDFEVASEIEEPKKEEELSQHVEDVTNMSEDEAMELLNQKLNLFNEEGNDDDDE